MQNADKEQSSFSEDSVMFNDIMTAESSNMKPPSSPLSVENATIIPVLVLETSSSSYDVMAPSTSTTVHLANDEVQTQLETPTQPELEVSINVDDNKNSSSGQEVVSIQQQSSQLVLPYKPNQTQQAMSSLSSINPSSIIENSSQSNFNYIDIKIFNLVFRINYFSVFLN